MNDFVKQIAERDLIYSVLISYFLENVLDIKVTGVFILRKFSISL